jgi:hypothetical protein
MEKNNNFNVVLLYWWRINNLVYNNIIQNYKITMSFVVILLLTTLPRTILTKHLLIVFYITIISTVFLTKYIF